MKRLFALCLLGASLLPGAAQVYTLNFDDLAYGTVLTGTTYGGVFWEQGNAGYNGNIGGWSVPPAGNVYPYSVPHDVINLWGSTLTGMRFSSAVDVQSAYFSAQGDSGGTTTGVRIHGYLNGSEVATTGWFQPITTTPALFNINLDGVDRIVVESQAVEVGGGWFGMDNFTYAVVPEPGAVSLLLFGVGLVAARRLARR